MAAKLNVIGIVVTDMARALAFYRALGLEIPSDADAQPHVEAEIASGVRLAWDTVAVIQSIDPEWQAPSGGHRIALSFQCDSPDDVNRMFESMVTRGHTAQKEPWDAFWGQRYAILLDPDGNAVDLYAPS